MPKKCKGKRNALVVTVVAVLLGDIFAGGQNIPAQQKTWNAGDTKRTQMTESATQRMDLTDAFAVILQGATKKFIAGYAVDDSFLMWLAARYGDEKVVRIASAVLDGTEDPEVWYDITGSSIHVLWLMYCRDSGFQQYRLQNVYWKEAGEDGKIVLGFAGDINFADDWYTMEYMNRQTNGIYDCFSEDLLSEMQNVDVMVMNNEFTYAESGSVEAVPGKAYTFRADPEDVELLSVFGTDAVTLANNHVYDYGEEGLLSTLDCLRKADIPYTGAGENRKEASKILSFVIGGRKIAIVSATQIERATKYTKEATETEPGVLKTLNPAAFLEVIREAVLAFKGVEHRIEFVAEKQGVAYYNDSKGTNPDAAIKGIQAMDRPTCLIGGGYDKQSEYTEWINSFDGKVKKLVLIGQTREKIAEEAEKCGFHDYVFADSLQEAVDICYENAENGDAVLLSPACASWGMFPNYEVRGKMFKEMVHALKE